MYDYYGSMDRLYGNVDNTGEGRRTIDHPVDVSGLTPTDIGTSTNPMMHQVQAFAAKIREGASRIELSFLGAGKSNSQQPSPEAFGKKEREDIRAMAELNNIQTSTHAALHGESLAGLGREGFSGEARQHVLKEIERAIQFAAEATKGGAIVFHTGEWQRPMSEIEVDSNGKSVFKSYREEDEKAPLIVVDKRTGEITGVRKDHRVYQPKFKTAKDFEEEKKESIIGKKDKNGNTVQANDWIDLDGNVIKREWVLDPEKAELLFNRVPVWDSTKTKFETEAVDFKQYEIEAAELRKKGGEYADITAEELFYKANTANQVLQMKGNSLYHAQRYEMYRESRDAAIKALQFYEKLDQDMPDEEKWKLMTQKGFQGADINQFTPAKNVPIVQHLKEQIEDLNNSMRHIHESSASTDAQAMQALEKMNNFVSIKKYGLDMTADTVAKAGMLAREYYLKNKEHLPEKIFAAPENWRPEQYGSHPDEIREIINSSRNEMAKRLRAQGMPEEQASQEAKDHIRATIDIGHFNMWRQHFQPKEGESIDDKNKRFEKWVVNEMEKLAKEGLIGHLHIADNFGFDDEHLTPGQGNAPIKEFVKIMEKHGLKDFIVEAGSYNGSTTMQDTWALIGSPVYGAGGTPQPRTFRAMRDQHFGYQNPSFYIAGAYSPSNEWKLWSEIPLE